MAVSAGDAFLDINARLASNFGRQLSSQAQGPVAKAGEQASHHFARSFGHSVATVGKGIGAGIAAGIGLAVVAAIKLLPVLKQSVQGYRDHLKVVAQTTAAIRSTGGAANVSVKQVGKLSDALERKTTVDGDVIQTGQNMLLTFTNVRNEVGKGNDIFNQASSTVLDMAAAFGHGKVSADGVQQASIQLGKALGDPIKGIGALSRVGVTFNDQQKKQIKTMVESGNILGAQKIILKELNKEFGGSAAAQATASGRMQVAWHQLQDTIGSVLLPVVDRFESSLGKKVIPDLNVLATRYGPAVQKTLLGWIDKFTKLLPSTKELGYGITALGAAFSGEGITTQAGTFVGTMERLGVKGRQIVDWARSLGPQLSSIGRSFGKLFQGASQAGPALQSAGGGGHVFANSLAIVGPVLDVVARNLHNIIPWLPAILGGFLAFRALKNITAPIAAVGETIGNIAQPFRVVAIFAQARALKALAAAQREQTVQSLAGAGAQSVLSDAENVSTLSLLRQRGAMIAQAVAAKVVAAASKAWAAVQWLVNAALTANPIGIVVVAIAALVAGIIIAYKHSETFRKIVQGAFNGVKAAVGAVVNFIIGAFRLWFNAQAALVLGILHMFGKLPGPMGAPFRAAEKAVTKARDTVNTQLDRIQAKVNRLTGKDIPIKVQGTVHWDKNAALLKQVTGNFTHKAPLFAEGGMVTVGTGPTSDDVLGRLSRGEFVVNARAVAQPGIRSALETLNGRRFAAGGFVDASRLPRLPGYTASTLGGATRSTLFGASRLRGTDALSILGGLGLGGPMPSSRNEAIVRQVAAMFGWVGPQWAALRSLLLGESGFRNTAQNPVSTAYGMYQFLNSTWGTVGGHKTSDPRLQSIYGDRYIRRVYGDPIGAYSAWLSRSPHWYDQGGMLPPGASVAVNRTGRPEPVGFDYDKLGDAIVKAMQRAGVGAVHLDGRRVDAQLGGARIANARRR